MTISKESLGRMLDEIEYVLAQMQQTASPQQALYTFSAVHGVVNRVMNFECDPVLVFAHQVLSTAHATFSSQFGTMGDRPNGPAVAAELLTLLQHSITGFSVALQSGGEAQVHQALQRIANITYAMTGNGYYLYTRGKLKLG